MSETPLDPPNCPPQYYGFNAWTYDKWVMQGDGHYKCLVCDRVLLPHPTTRYDLSTMRIHLSSHWTVPQGSNFASSGSAL
jgi:hypothetical protein